MVLALIASANDGDTSVKGAIAKSLLDIGKKQPNLVLSSCYDFIQKNQKVQLSLVLINVQLIKEHRVILLNVMYQVLELKREEVSSSLAQGLILQAIDEMTKEKVS